MTAVANTDETRPVGRPTKYQGSKTIAMVNLCARRHMTHRQIARALGISSPTLYEWADRYPEFASALQSARDMLVSRYEQAMLDQATGAIQGSATAGIFMLKNLAPDEYRDRREHQVEVKDFVELDFTGFDDDAIDGEFEELDDAD